jgi:ubiquinone/menaquinone biosynthesis C-methylase UbiE
LPFADRSFDASLAVLTVHHWADLDAGLAEVRRVTRDRIVIVTFDPEALADLWIARDYFPEMRALKRRAGRDLESGTWEKRYGHLRTVSSLDVGLRLVSVPCSHQESKS